MAHRRGFRPRPGLLRDDTSVDAESRQTRRRGRALHPRLHDRSGVFGEPVGLHDRHVSDDDRRAQSPLASRRRLSDCPLACACCRTGCAMPATSRRTSSACPPAVRFQRHRQDRLEFHLPGAAVRFGSLGRPQVASAILSRRSIFRRRTGSFTRRRRRTPPRSSSRRIIPTIR